MPQTDGGHNPPVSRGQLKENAMDNQIRTIFDATSDIGEIGLMAAASPDFMDALVRALLAASQDVDTASEQSNASTTQVAA
jgi:hypothetical protein